MEARAEIKSKRRRLVLRQVIKIELSSTIRRERETPDASRVLWARQGPQESRTSRKRCWRNSQISRSCKKHIGQVNASLEVSEKTLKMPLLLAKSQGTRRHSRHWRARLAQGILSSRRIKVEPKVVIKKWIVS